MSIRIMGWVFDHSAARGIDRLVMLALTDSMDDEGRCWPGIKRIARKCRVSERTVQRSLQALQDLNEIGIDRRESHSSVYYIGECYPRPDGSDGWEPEGGGCQSVTGDKAVTRGVTHLSPQRTIIEPSIPKPISAREEESTKKRRKTSLPSGVPSEEDKAWWRAHWVARGVTELNADLEAEKFRDHHSGKGSVFASWASASRQWGRRAAEYCVERKSRAAGLNGAAKGGSGIPHREFSEEEKAKMAAWRLRMQKEYNWG